jgi:hypothetical protein
MEPWMVYRSVMTDSHHINEVQDPDPYYSDKLTLLVVVGYMVG